MRQAVEIESAALDVGDGFRGPGADGEAVGDDARAGAEFATEAGAEAFKDGGGEEDRHDIGAPDGGFEEVLEDEGGAGFDAGGTGIGGGFGDAGGVEVVTDGAGVERSGGGDGDAAVAAAEIDEEIAFAHRGEFEHLADDGGGGLYVWHVEAGAEIEGGRRVAGAEQERDGEQRAETAAH